ASSPQEDHVPNINPERNPIPQKDNTSSDRFVDSSSNKYKLAMAAKLIPGLGNFPDEHAEVVKNIDTGTSTSSSEENVGVHGLININTANWKVLSTVPFTSDSVRNADIAKAIVNYREFGDPTNGDPALPFRSLYDLLKVKGTISSSPGIKTFTQMHQLPPPNAIPND